MQQIFSQNKYYIITVSTVSSNGYTLTAAAQDIQAQKDTNCLNIKLIVTAEQDDIRDPPACWTT